MSKPQKPGAILTQEIRRDLGLAEHNILLMPTLKIPSLN